MSVIYGNPDLVNPKLDITVAWYARPKALRKDHVVSSGPQENPMLMRKIQYAAKHFYDYLRQRVLEV
jgi:hypothetical protein